MDVRLRAGRTEDLIFARTIYFEEMRWIIEQLFGWDEAKQVETFPEQFKVKDVEIIIADGVEIGWLQLRHDESAIHLSGLYVTGSMQRKGIGSAMLKMLLARAAGESKAVTLGVVKINPARSLYERHGFRITHEDEHKFYMRADPPS